MFKTNFFRFSIYSKNVLRLNMKHFSSKFFAPGSPYVKEITDKIYPKLPDFEKIISPDELQNTFKKICNLITQQDYEEANIEANRFLNESMILQDEKSECRAFLLMGTIQAKRQEYDSAIDKFECALDIMRGWEEFDKFEFINLLKNLSICHEMKKEYNQSIDYAKQLLIFTDEKSNYRFTFDILQNLSRLYKLSEKYQECLNTSQEILNLLNTKNKNNKSLIVSVKVEILELKIKLNHNDVKQILEDLNHNLIIAKELKLNEVLLKIYYLLALLYKKQGNIQSSTKMASYGLELFRDGYINEKYELLDIISSNHIQLKNYKNALISLDHFQEFIKNNYYLHEEENHEYQLELEDINKKILKICIDSESTSVIKENYKLLEIFKSALYYRYNFILMEPNLYKNLYIYADDIKLLEEGISKLKDFINVDRQNNIIVDFHKKLNFLKIVLDLNIPEKDELGERIIKDLEQYK